LPDRLLSRFSVRLLPKPEMRDFIAFDEAVQR
jgi:hypothetical protein